MQPPSPPPNGLPPQAPPNGSGPPQPPGGNELPNSYGQPSNYYPAPSAPAVPEAPYPAPPPGPQPTEYDFILSGGKSPAPNYGGPESFRKRLIIVGVGAFLLLVIASFAFSLLSRGGDEQSQALLSLAREQTELVRVADIGMEKGRGTDAKVLASITRGTIQGDLNTSIVLLKSAGIKTDQKKLAGASNPATDQALTVADQSNRFDDEFLKVMQDMLLRYRTNVQAVHGAATTATQKQALATSFKNINTILGPAVASEAGPTPTTPPPPPGKAPVQTAPPTQNTTPGLSL